ncbi:UNVERIFIED_CONTAM: hypothetical protein K2H54_037013 [Gekko kuhli]
MAGVVGGITRLFQPTVGVLASDKTCRGLNPWYFLVGLHLVSVFFAYGPWDAAKSDLVCHWPSSAGDEKTFCNALCYNQRFPVAISSSWALHLLVMLIMVALMKFVYVTVKKKDSSGKDVETAVEPTPDQGTSAVLEWYDVVGKTEFGGWRYKVYMLCIIAILAATSIFMFVLIAYQLPAVMQKTFTCTPENAACPGSVQCTFTGRSDKRAILWAMACCSGATIILCIGYLATHVCRACGFCGGHDGAKKARTGHGSREVEGGGRRSREEGRDTYSEGSGGGAGGRGHRGDGGARMAGCRCQFDGENCCCAQGYDSSRNVACGCYENRRCPCYFQGSDTGQSLSSLASKEESEGTLLRGDTEHI